MTKRQKNKKFKKTARKIKVLKVVPIEPDKHIVELEIEGAPAPIPEIPAELFPLEIEPSAAIPQDAPENAFMKWWRGLW